MDNNNVRVLKKDFDSACKLRWSNEDLTNYFTLKEAAGKYYQTFRPTRCPILNDRYVNFSSEGFNHLIYKNKIERSKKEQFMRFKFIEQARDTIGKTTTYQEYDEKLQEVVVKHKKKRCKESKLIKYWGLITIVGKWKIKVIIKQTGNGGYTFWSVIPFWRTEKYGDVRFKTFTKNALEDE